MRAIFVAIVLVSSFGPALRARGPQGKISCHAYGMPKARNPNFAKKLWDGYEISLGLARNSQGGGDECTAGPRRVSYNRL
jgi:hypothetical protein